VQRRVMRFEGDCLILSPEAPVEILVSRLLVKLTAGGIEDVDIDLEAYEDESNKLGPKS